MNRDHVRRDNIAGFMLGVSVGVGIGFFLKSSEETESRVPIQRADYLKNRSDRRGSPRSGPTRKE